MGIRTNYRDRIKISLKQNDVKLYTQSGLLVANGYERIVIGDRGPYIEVSTDNIVKDAIKIPKGLEHRLVSDCYYVEYRSIDESNIKVYHQKKTVWYADYLIGLYYISPFDLKTDEMDELVKPLIKGRNLNSSKFFKNK